MESGSHRGRDGEIVGWNWAGTQRLGWAAPQLEGLEKGRMQRDRDLRILNLVLEEMCEGMGTGRNEACRKVSTVCKERMIFIADRWDV